MTTMEKGNNKVLIFAEQEEGKIAAITRELLGAGSKLAKELDGELDALIIGSNGGDAAQKVFSYGADKVYLLDDASLSDYNPDKYTSAITQVCQQIAPSIILLGHTTIGHDIAARIAYRLKCFPYTDATKLNIDPDSKSLSQTRMVYSGKAIGVLGSKGSYPQLATIRPGSLESLAPDSSRKGEILNINVDLSSATPTVKLVSTEKSETGEAKLEEAEVVVAGGGGIGSAEGFELLRDLARIWNGAIGATRVPCDEGWLPSTSYEIGLTGKTVKPKLYFAVGISGAAQHTVGCSESKCIVAINRDPDASIFKVSDFGVVGDYKAVVPELTEKCRTLKR